MRQIALFLSLLLLAPLADLAAQEASPLAPGARVRVSVRQQTSIFNPRETGTLVALNADTLVLKIKDRNTPLAIPLASVSRLDVSRGQVPGGNHTGIGAGIGFLAGGAALSLFALSQLRDSDYDVGGESFIYTFLIGGVPGALIGGIVGSGAGGERWERVPLERIRVGVAPQRHGGIRLAAAFRF